MPTCYLRSREKEPKLPDPKPMTERTRVKPPVPLRSEKPAHGLCSSKDFVKTNAVEVGRADSRQTSVLVV